MAVPTHEKLEVYQIALDAAVELDAVAHAIPSERRDLRDQLRRASASILLNIAEGASEFSPDEKARFYRMARRSAAECTAVLDLLARTGRLSRGGRATKARLVRIISMLTRLVKAIAPLMPVSVAVALPGTARTEGSNNVP